MITSGSIKVKSSIDSLKNSPAALLAYYLSSLAGYVLAPRILKVLVFSDILCSLVFMYGVCR